MAGSGLQVRMPRTPSTLRPSRPGCVGLTHQTSAFSLGTWAWGSWKVGAGGFGGGGHEAPQCIQAHTTPLLSAGYDSIDSEMSKPDLRAELGDLKLICGEEGQAGGPCISRVQKYKLKVFIEAVAKARK